MDKERWFGTHIMEVVEMFRDLKDVIDARRSIKEAENKGTKPWEELKKELNLTSNKNSASSEDFEVRLQYLNKCLCCAERGIASYAEMYGTGDSSGFDCSSEVCVICLESGCPCGGRRLEKMPNEVHIGCNHSKSIEWEERTNNAKV